MKSYFSSQFFKGNRERLRKLVNNDAPIVITANSLLQRNSDMPFRFRQDSNFWYLTGIIEPDFVLVMDKTGDHLISPGRSQYRTIFDGSLDNAWITSLSGITQILDDQTGWKQLASSLSSQSKVATIAAPPAYVEQYEFYSNPARAILVKKLELLTASVEILDVRNHFATMRAVKLPCEVAAIKGSVDMTVKVFKKLRAKLNAMNYEYEVEAYLDYEFRSCGAQVGYTPMVASGINACTLHHEASQDKLSHQGLLLIDAGAEVEYYSADITRTYVLGVPSKRQIAVHKAVVEVQDYVLGYIKPGISVKESEKKAVQYMGEKLQQLGLIKTVDNQAIRQYYPHATSHFLGLDVHDAGDYERPLEPGMVLTVEPGIYIPKEGIGVRIEDDVLITKTGHKILSAKLPRIL